MTEPDSLPCPHCNQPVPTTEPICPHCGRLVNEELLNSGATMKIQHVWILAAVVAAITVAMVIVLAMT
jgi:predicted amidophosphoribosyltransferase